VARKVIVQVSRLSLEGVVSAFRGVVGGSIPPDAIPSGIGPHEVLESKTGNSPKGRPLTGSPPVKTRFIHASPACVPRYRFRKSAPHGSSEGG
jgi:hypothetical protein